MNDAQSTIVGLRAQSCPSGGWNGMPAELEGKATVADCLADGSCGCIYGDAVQHIERMSSTDWMPIETAPKNKLLLVGFFNSAGKWRSMHARWRDDLSEHDMAEAEDEPAPAGWYEGSLEAEMLFPVRPTHWMFLPAPPAR